MKSESEVAQSCLTHFSTNTTASLIAQSVKNLPAIWETQVQSMGWEDPLEKEMANHSSTLAWKILWTEEPGGLPSMGSQSRTRLKRLSSSSICSPGIINKILPLLFSHPSFSIQIFLFACVFILIVF